MRIFLLWSTSFLICWQCLSQDKEVVDQLRNFQLAQVKVALNGYSEFSQQMINHQADFLMEFDARQLFFDTLNVYDSSTEVIGKFYYHINKADYLYYVYDHLNVHARDEYVKAIELALENDHSALVCEGIKKLLTLNRLSYLNNNYFSSDYYLNKYEQHVYDQLEQGYLNYYRLLFKYRNSPATGRWDRELQMILTDFISANSVAILNAQILNLFANYYYNVLKDFDQAVAFNQLALNYLEQIPHQYKASLQKKVYIGLIRHHVFEARKEMKANQENPKILQARDYLKLMDTTTYNKVDKYYKRYFYFYQSAVDTTFGRFKEGYSNFREYTRLSEKGAIYDNVDAIRILEIEYQTEQQKEEIQEQASVITRQQGILRTLAVPLILLSVLSIALFLAIRNIRGKNRKIETLMRELHHRVKNNLQVISSLLGLQSMKLDDEVAKKAVNEGKSRIRAMSLIHQKLYQNEEVTKLDIKEYLNNLVLELAQAYGFQQKAVLKIEAPSDSFDADTSLPIGLIINELVSNSFKYAFVQEDQPELTVSLSRNGDHGFLLVVSDNGCGLPEDFDLKTAESFGLKLVNLLVKQLKGTITHTNHNHGCEFSIRF